MVDEFPDIREHRYRGAAARWWQQPDQYEWLSGYLHARGLATPTRRLMALVSLALVFMPIGLLRTPNQSPILIAALSVIAATIGISYAILWLRVWPSRIQSLTLIVTGGAVTLASIAAADPIIALTSCNGLVVLGGYLAFFHNAKAVICSVIVAIIAGGFCASRVAEANQNSHLAIAGFWVVVEVSALVPLAIHAVVRTLGADVVRSDQDALTGLLNRRAFYERATALLATPGNDLRLIVIMVDLDKFKHLNDTYGHLAGDQALNAVGWALRQESSGTAIIGRAGGEEFVIIDAVRASEVEKIPLRLCAAIAALPHSVTASIGAAVVPYVQVSDPISAMDLLVQFADTAMYQAKRDGGNRVNTRTFNALFR